MSLVLILITPLGVFSASPTLQYLHTDGKGHSVSVSGHMPKSFDMSYTASRGGANEAASFVIDGTTFHVASPGGAVEKITEGGPACQIPNACIEKADDGQRNIHVSFTGAGTHCPQVPAIANVPVYGVPFCNDPYSMLLDALLKGFGILTIFLCTWVLIRRFEKEHQVRPISSRSRLRATGTGNSRVSSLHRSWHDAGASTKEYKDIAVVTDAHAQELSPASPIVVKCESEKSVPVAVNGTGESCSGSSIYTDTEPLSPPAPPKKWTPHSDVSNGHTFVAVPPVLLPPERNLTPPPPPPATIPNYNPVLGQPRPAKIEKILSTYDFMFLIDDSGSMHGSPWSEARESINELANWILDNGWDRNGISLRFLNSTQRFHFKDLNGISDKNKIRSVVNNVQPNGGTPTGRRCFELLSAHIEKLERTKGTPEYARTKPLILVVITDGAPTDGHEYSLSRVLLLISSRLKACHHHPNSMAVQFVQVGNDPNAAQALKVLTQLNTNGMVDAISSADLGSLSPDKLGQLMLGGVHPNVRSKVV